MKQIAAALVAVQGALKSAIKDSENAAFKNGAKVSKYADLTAVWDVCRKPLSENGLCVIQTTDFDDTGAWLKTTLLHTSGESIEGGLLCPWLQSGALSKTYMRSCWCRVNRV
jgi:hypothetical protein